MQAYIIDRIKLITYKNQKKKIVNSIRCRYLAKSHFVKCNAKNQSFVYVNFRGAIFTNVQFQKSEIIGCDFWGTTFNNCDFKGANISGCVIMACKFKNCDFTNTTIVDSTIVNTSLSECKNIEQKDNIIIYKIYPKVHLSERLESTLNVLKTDRNLRKCKLLHISDKKNNDLNLFLLQQRFTDEALPSLLKQLADISTKKITTYKSLELILEQIEKTV